MNAGKDRDKPTIKRKEECNVEAVLKEVAIHRAKKRPSKKEHVAATVIAIKKQQTLQKEGIDEFEERLISKCKSDGMSDSEIQEWIQEF